ncbi:MAG TPA: hypothetical protein VM029_02955 [Opitutaceae bacterium]|nr:hypothetical protein [Opitutaceae bacterium]
MRCPTPDSLAKLALLGLLAAASPALAAPPTALATALERLRDQKSYSWEVINADPGPVATQLETRRGTITTVQQNMSPHIKGSIDRNGDTLIERDWSDGLRLDTAIAADGAMITKTPEGWMTDREILSALAEERLQGQGATPRYRWLRRADRPDVRRPDQELVPFLKMPVPIEASGDTYVVRARIRADGTAVMDDDDSQPSTNVTITMNVKGGVIRDYEVKLDTSRPVTRMRVQMPMSEQRIVIITYLPITRIDLPNDARDKLKSARSPASTYRREEPKK